MIKYAHDYNKAIAHLVVFNLTAKLLQFQSDGPAGAWAPYVEAAGVRVHLIAVRALPPAGRRASPGRPDRAPDGLEQGQHGQVGRRPRFLPDGSDVAQAGAPTQPRAHTGCQQLGGRGSLRLGGGVRLDDVVTDLVTSEEGNKHHGGHSGRHLDGSLMAGLRSRPTSPAGGPANPIAWW